MAPASSGNWARRSVATARSRSWAGLFMSPTNSCSRKTVSPSLSVIWNQSRQVTRLPDQLWKYSWPTTRSKKAMSASVAVSARPSTRASLKMLRPLFSIAPKLKKLTATIMNRSRSYSRPKRSSSQRMAFLSAAMAKPVSLDRPGSV